ncbi:hypothetical protein CR983_00905 [Candidatus Saccharibacteria bacterium]|nr:MAG: hypothetical protein CR983_00905 [Candidatus Saccharibacteria bacterium]
MHITHVIRGQEFISSMPNYLALYEALGFDMEPASVQTAQESAAAKPARTTSEQPSHPEGSAFPAERGQEDSNWRPRVPEGGDGREEGRGNEADPTRAASDNHDTDEHSALPAEVGQDKLVISDRPYARGVMGGDGGEETISRAATDNRQSSGYSAFPAEVGQGEWQLAVRPYTRGLMGGGGGEARPTRTGIEQRSGGDGREEGRGSETAGKKLPIFAHMPHIMNEQGNKKLGKRDGAKDVLDYIKSGYLPEALVSFIATLGWNDGTEQEIFTRDELIKTFSLDRIQRSGARFDEKRLLWMNGHFIRQLPLDELATRVKPYWPEAAAHADDAYKMRVLALAQDRLKTLCDLAGLSEFFFTEPTPDLALLTSNKQLKKLSVETQQQLLQTAHDALSNIEDWHAEHIQTRLNELLEQTGQKPGTLFSLIRIATTWAPFSPQLDDTLALLGRDKTLARLAQAIRLIAA